MNNVRIHWLILLTCTLLGCKGEKPVAAGNNIVIPDDGPSKVRSSGSDLVDPTGAPLQLRCVNVDSWLYPIPYLVSDSGNALFVSPTEFAGRLTNVVGAEQADSFWAEWRARFFTESDVRRIAALGLNCARIVLYHRAITTTDSGHRELDEDALEHIDDAVSWGRKHNVYMILDLHTAPGGQNGVSTVSDVPSTDQVPRLWESEDAAANQDATIEIWRGLAARYAASTVVAGYDLLNEPALPESVESSALPEFYSRIITAVREVDDTHLLFIEGDELAHDFSAFTEPLDDNMAFSFHVYSLTGFEDWAEPSQALMQPYVDLRTNLQRPLWIGEFGENDVDWQASVVQLSEDNDIGWALYPWKRKQTLFWNPVFQRIKDTPKWYALADYMARPNSDMEAPSEGDAREAMDEILQAIALENCVEDGGLANALIRP